MKQYIVGTEVTLEGKFYDEEGGLADPDSVSAEIRLPGGTVEDLTSSVSKDAVGIYSVAYTPTTNGLYEYRFSGTGSLIAAGENSFMAQTFFPPES